jgi:hypothetical protein
MDLCGLIDHVEHGENDERLRSPCTVRKWARETVADPDRLHLRCTIAMNTMGGSRLFAVGPTRLPSVCATMFACWWLIPLGLPHTIHAQVTPPITSSGLNTQVSKSPANSLQYDITAGTRAGSNLFHSFGEFSVPTSHIANFSQRLRPCYVQHSGPRHGRQSLQHLRHPPNDRIRQCQSVPDEPGRNLVRSDCVFECWRIREPHDGGLPAFDGRGDIQGISRLTGHVYSPARR